MHLYERHGGLEHRREMASGLVRLAEVLGDHSEQDIQAGCLGRPGLALRLFEGFARLGHQPLSHP